MFSSFGAFSAFALSLTPSRAGCIPNRAHMGHWKLASPGGNPVSPFRLGPSQASMVWLEPHRVHVGGQTRAIGAFPDEDQLAQVLSNLPQGPTKWIVDDLWTPALLLKDFVELPSGVEARDAFFRWRYTQHLALEDPQSVQTLEVEAATWLLVGMPQAQRETWIQLALRLGRPIHAMVPRWLWIYNHLAPTLQAPGMMLSLAADEDGYFTGTLAAWGRTLTLLRQWHEPASAEAWMEERVLPTAAFLQRENRSPQELLIWGASTWPKGILSSRLLPFEIPAQEAL